LFLPAIWFGCNKTNDGSFVLPITVHEKVAGNWQLSSLQMIDETARKAGIMPDQIDLTSQLNFPTFKIALNVDGNNKATDFIITGNAPALINPAGYWDLDNSFPPTDGTPVNVILYSDAAKTARIGRLQISTMPGAKDEMVVKLTHTSNQVPYATYQYKLVLPTK
jgi:hypothetical protein